MWERGRTMEIIIITVKIRSQLELSQPFLSGVVVGSRQLDIAARSEK